MRGVRKFCEADIPLVADLHRRTFGIDSPLSADRLSKAYRNYLHRVFLDYPGCEDSVHPLVYENDGAVIGFLGAVARRFRFQGKTVRAAVCTQFVVDPAHRGLPGLLLLRVFMKGEQDFSFADECNDASRDLWGLLGAATVFHQSIPWYFPIRPVSFAARRISLLRPLTGIGDRMAARFLRGPFTRHPRVLRERTLHADHVAHFHRAGGLKLVPDYPPEQLRWLLGRAAELEQLHGKLEGAVLVSGDDQPAGCFLYHVPRAKVPGGPVSKVIHFAADPQHTQTVLRHLFHHASEKGVAALSGRVPPEYLAAFSSAQCILYPPVKWFLLHSRNPEISAAICRGEFQFTPLDGEWCCHFNYLSSAR